MESEAISGWSLLVRAEIVVDLECTGWKDFCATPNLGAEDHNIVLTHRHWSILGE